MIQLFGLFDLKAPGNVLAYLNFYDKITGFELIDFQAMIEGLGYVPELDSFSINF